MTLPSLPTEVLKAAAARLDDYQTRSGITMLWSIHLFGMRLSVSAGGNTTYDTIDWYRLEQTSEPGNLMDVMERKLVAHVRK